VVSVLLGFIVGELVAGCEVNLRELLGMKCKYPFFIARKRGKYTRMDMARMPAQLLNDYIPHPCGRCMQCRILKAKSYTCRCILEATQHPENAFVTLTYDEELCPPGGSLYKKDLQNYFKRLRKRLKQPFRYFAVGEYGQNGTRKLNPHFHILLFNVSHLDERIRLAWHHEGVPFGFVGIGEVTPMSARYCTEYAVKKWDKKNGRTPEGYTPEYMVSSKGSFGGIGSVAIKPLARNMRRSYGLGKDEMWPGEPPVKIRFQNKHWPLDRYMRNKLWDALKVNPKIQEDYKRQYLLDQFDELSEGKGAVVELTDTIKFRNKEIATKWDRKYFKRLKTRIL
jgi:hypothetical protein